MLKKTITYTDYNGKTRTEDFWFHLTEAELTMYNMSHDGGMEARLKRIISTEKASEIMEVFEDILKRSYGVKSDDGRRFIKNDEVYNEFRETEAYSKIFMELCTNAKAAAEFAEGIMPRELAEEAKKAMKKNPEAVKLPTADDSTSDNN